MVLEFTESKSAARALRYHQDHLAQGEYLQDGVVGQSMWGGAELARMGMAGKPVDARSFAAVIFNVDPSKIKNIESFDKRVKDARKRPAPLKLDEVKEGTPVRVANRGNGKIRSIEGAVAEVELERSKEIVHVDLAKLKSPERTFCRFKDEKLTPRARKTPGWDFTFSAPKGVSMLWAAGAKEVEEAFNEAVSTTMKEMEQFAQTRVRVGSGDNQMDEQRFTGNLVWSSFVHGTSRPVVQDDGQVTVDPHLHAHIYVHNVTFDPVEERWKALQNRGIVRKIDHWEARFESLFSRLLYQKGFDVARRGKSFDLAALTPEAIAQFSQRTKQVNDTAKKLGITDAKTKGELGARTRAAKKLAKDINLTEHMKERAPEVFERLQELRRVAPRLKSVMSADGPLPLEQRIELAAEAVQYALDRALERSATTTLFGVYADAQRYAGAARCLLDEELYQALEARDDIVLGDVDQWGDMKLTTELVVAQEVRLLELIRASREQYGPMVTTPRLSRQLSSEQRTALMHILSSKDQFTYLRGQAGTGKSFVLKHLVREVRRSGIQPVALAPTASASRGALRDAELHDADTLAKFLGPSRTGQGLRHQAKEGLIILDEAGLAGTEDMLKLAETACRLKARVLLVGDTRQLDGVQRGSPLHLLERDGLVSAELKEIRRQTEPNYREVVSEMAEGRPIAGLQKAMGFGFVTEVRVDIEDDTEEPQNRGDELAAKCAAQHIVIAYQQKKSCIVVAPTHALGQVVTASTREALQSNGLVGEDLATMTVCRPVDRTVADRRDFAHSLVAGDIVVMQRDDKDRKLLKGDVLIAKENDRGKMQLFLEDWPEKSVRHGIDAEACAVYRRAEIPVAIGDQVRAVEAIPESKMERGDRGVVTHISRWKNTITLDDGRIIPMDAERLDYGYVVTVFGAQGQTADHCIVVATTSALAAMNREAAYVADSRGREKLHIITDSVSELMEAVGQSMVQGHAIDVAAEAARRDKARLDDELKTHEAEARGRADVFEAAYDEDRLRMPAPANVVLERPMIEERAAEVALEADAPMLEM
ncbi:MAG: MobF family relaxase [Myxococcota bacterium]